MRTLAIKLLNMTIPIEVLFEMENYTTTTIDPLPSRNDALKTVLLLVLFFATLLASQLPFALRRAAFQSESHRRRHQFAIVFSVLSCFGGGIFLSTCLLDLLPDAIQSIAKGQQKIHITIRFPLAELLVAVGFLIVLTLEQTIVFAREMHWISGSHVDRLLGQDDDRLLPNSAITRRSRSTEETEEDESTTTDDVHFNPDVHSTMRAMLLVFALSLHAVFEGLSVGVMLDTSELMQVFVALCIHKTLIGFSLGLRLVQCTLRVTTIIAACTLFAAMVLVGGFIGLAIDEFIGAHPQSLIVTGCLQALACGTFLYVTLFEILPHELNQSGQRPLKLCCLFAGCAVIAAFIAIFPDND